MGDGLSILGVMRADGSELLAAWSLRVRQRQILLEDLVDPKLGRVHARRATGVMLHVDAVILPQRLPARLAAQVRSPD